MSRIKVGEGIEVEKKDFAAEVAEQSILIYEQPQI
jgi:translation elongation factor EF-Ts